MEACCICDLFGDETQTVIDICDEIPGIATELQGFRQLQDIFRKVLDNDWIDISWKGSDAETRLNFVRARLPIVEVFSRAMDREIEILESQDGRPSIKKG